MKNKISRKIQILNVFCNGWDEKNIFVDVLVGLDEGGFEKHTLVLSQQTSKYLLKALSLYSSLILFINEKFVRRIKWKKKSVIRM